MPALRSAIWTGVGFVVGTLFGYVSEDVGKPLYEIWIEQPVAKMIPWDNSYVQVIFPNFITFESTTVSGCSGGSLERLVSDAKRQGMKFRDEELTSKTFLCEAWNRTGTAASILDAMASAYKNCFVVRGHGSDREFEVLTPEPYVCQTDYVIDPQTNQWTPKQGLKTILCLTGRVPGPPSSKEPYARPCPVAQLKTVGIIP